LKALLFANTDWYLYNFRLPLAKALRSGGYDVVLLSPPGDYARLLTEEGFRWIRFPFSRGVNPLTELATLWRLIGLYRRERPDLVHHFTIKCVLYGGIAARWSRAKAIVSSVTGLGHVFITHSWLNRLLRPAVSLVYRFVLGRSQIIFQNPDDRSEFLRLALVEEGRTHLIRGSGVDTEYFRPPADAGRERPATVLMMGRLLREKGVREFVEAAAIVRKQLPGVQFLLAGDSDPGNPSSIAPDVVAEWQRMGDVSFLGHRSDIRELIQAADLAVLPSYREGLPRSLLEAAACGLPLVATDVPGCREIVSNKLNGLLVPPLDSKLLAEAIIELLGDRERREAMGKRSRAMACELFSQDRVVRETMGVYVKALDDWAKRASR
jgi:glycosyltransferase involved in cell wall biosynthesis